MTAYPCDNPHDMLIEHKDGEQVYSVYHRNGAQRAGTTKFIKKDSREGVASVHFGAAATHRGAVNDEIDEAYQPPIDQPEVRNIKIGDSIETVLEKLGVSDEGKEHLKNHLDLQCVWSDSGWTFTADRLEWKTMVKEPQHFTIDWKKETTGALCLQMIFNGNGILERIDYLQFP